MHSAGSGSIKSRSGIVDSGAGKNTAAKYIQLKPFVATTVWMLWYSIWLAIVFQVWCIHTLHYTLLLDEILKLIENCAEFVKMKKVFFFQMPWSHCKVPWYIVNLVFYCLSILNVSIAELTAQISSNWLRIGLVFLRCG